MPSPESAELVELPLIELLAERGTTVVCAGGGGIPVTRDATGALHGVETVVDKDRTAALLAHATNADALLLLTDVDAVYDNYGTARATPIRRATSRQLRARSFPDGSMAPKIEAVCRLIDAGGRLAAIGRLDDAESLLNGGTGTTITES